MKNILITGGSGTIGKILMPYLLGYGYNVDNYDLLKGDDVFDEEKLDEKNISDLLKKNPNKMIIFVFSNITENKLIIKFQNYKKIYFLSDKSYSVHTALKSDMVLFSKKSLIYNSYIGNN